MRTRAWVRLVLAGTPGAGCGSYMEDYPVQTVEQAPVQPVELTPARLDVTEVTVDAYRACVASGACSEPVTGGACNWDVADRGNHPVNCVTWHQAMPYCSWAGERLPTEEEWDTAARGAERRAFPW